VGKYGFLWFSNAWESGKYLKIASRGTDDAMCDRIINRNEAVILLPAVQVQRIHQRLGQ
jgi:hypothetical protein